MLEQNFSKRKEAKENHKIAKEAKQKALTQKMSSVLNADQMKRFEILKAEKKSKRRAEAKMNGDKKHHQKKGDKKDGAQKLKKLTERLNLSEKQQAEVSLIFQAEKEDRKKHRSDLKLKRDKLKSKFEKDMKTILTQEQFSKFQTLKKEYHSAKKAHEHKH